MGLSGSSFRDLLSSKVSIGVGPGAFSSNADRPLLRRWRRVVLREVAGGGVRGTPTAGAATGELPLHALARAPCTRALHASRPHSTLGGACIPSLPPRYLPYPRRLTRKGGPPAFGWRLANHQGAGSRLEPTRATSIALRRTLATLTWQGADALVVGARTGRGTGRVGSEGADGRGWIRSTRAEGAAAGVLAWRVGRRACTRACERCALRLGIWARGRTWQFCRWSRPAGQPNGLDHGVALLHMIIVRAVSCLICKLYT